MWGGRKWRRTDITVSDDATNAKVVVKLWDKDCPEAIFAKKITVKNLMTTSYKSSIQLTSTQDTCIVVNIHFLLSLMIC
jgi:hypothetical protein